MKNIKTVIKCVAFILIFLIILAILSKIFVRKNNSTKEKTQEYIAKGILAEPDNTIDVLVVGDSEAYSSYIPLEIWNDYGFTSYVCATSKQILPHTASFIYDATKRQDIKIVLLEADNLYRKSSVEKPIVEVVNHIFPVFEYHDRWKNLNISDLWEDVNYTNIQEGKGYYYSKKIRREKDRNRKVNPNPKVPEYNKIYLKKIKEYCDSKGIKLMMYSCSNKSDWNMNRHNGIEEVAKELNVDYVDLNLKKDEVNIDWEKDSRDGGVHLNYTGASKVTKFLGKYLSNTNILKDHRSDPAYDSWNNYYENFKEKIKN